MKTAVIVLLALVAIVGAQRVNVVQQNVTWYPWTVDITELNFTAVNLTHHNSTTGYNDTTVHVVDHNPNEVHVVDRNPLEVHVVDNNPTEVHVVDHNPSEVHVVDHNPSEVHVVDHNPSEVHVVDNNPAGVIVDQAFYRPNNPPRYEQISTGPTFVNFGNRPGKQYDSPYLRGGK
ncbi:uncharacterized protein [Battus philenor]|uniref:uncharacterized protein isoform X3 n=1 Tax=Battus philenor TaxID=42288 RepID=UPI0035CF6D4E